MKHEHTEECEHYVGRSPDEILHRQLIDFVGGQLRQRMGIAMPDETAGITRRYIDLWCQLHASDALQRIAKMPDVLAETLRAGVEGGVASLREDGTLDRIMDAMGITAAREGKAS